MDEFSRRANHAKLYLLKLAYELAGRSVPAETVVVEGYGTAESIVEFAEAHGIDLIAMASHGREGFKRFLMGSVAGSVARRTLIPVFVVKPKSAKSSGKRGQSRKKSMPAAGVPRRKSKERRTEPAAGQRDGFLTPPVSGSFLDLPSVSFRKNGHIRKMRSKPVGSNTRCGSCLWYGTLGDNSRVGECQNSESGSYWNQGDDRGTLQIARDGEACRFSNEDVRFLGKMVGV